MLKSFCNDVFYETRTRSLRLVAFNEIGFTLTGYGTGTLMATVLVTLIIFVGTSLSWTDCEMSFG